MKKTLSREEQLFMAASELSDKNDREIFLRQACGDDLSLYDRVTDLLALDSQSGNILDETSEGLFEVTTEEETIQAGAMIGQYKLLQQIGTGGMGVVFMARQSKPIRRKVAIKVIRFGLDSKNVIARFEAERQALAIMDHPGITRVFDAGTTSCGRPYFVMELINGLTITKYCDKNKISPRERVELFLQVCNAVQHAHQKGVIHRDIKPSNVLVTHYDGVPVPKIIDFGIAKALDRPLTEKTLFTSYGNMIGTPEYMSPEQAEMSGLDTDVCSDVYSLGVVLFELLTGTTPFYEHKNSGLRKICDAICTQDAELASTRVTRLTDSSDELSGNRRTDAKGLRQFLRGDMDWIIARCLNKDRRERYQTAAALAEDISRYLGGDVVDAAGPSPSYRLKKFASRHRAALALAGVVAAALVTTTAISTTFAFRAYNAEQIALEQMGELDDARQAALDAADRADAALQLAEEERDRADEALLTVQRQRDEAVESERRIAELERESRSRAELAVRLLNVMNEEQKRKFEASIESQEDLPQRRFAPSNAVGNLQRNGVFGGGGGYGGGGFGFGGGGVVDEDYQTRQERLLEMYPDGIPEGVQLKEFFSGSRLNWMLPNPWQRPGGAMVMPPVNPRVSGNPQINSVGPEFGVGEAISGAINSFDNARPLNEQVDNSLAESAIMQQASPATRSQSPAQFQVPAQTIEVPAQTIEGYVPESAGNALASGQRSTVLQSEWYPGIRRRDTVGIDQQLADGGILESDSTDSGSAGETAELADSPQESVTQDSLTQESVTGAPLMQMRTWEPAGDIQADFHPLESGESFTVEVVDGHPVDGHPNERVTEVHVEHEHSRQLVDISANQIQLAENGSILIMNPDGTVAMSLLDDSGDYMTPIGLSDLDENSLGYVDKILTVVIDTNRSVYGDDAMMLCEPQMMRAQVKMQNFNWIEAEEDLRQCEMVLLNNSVSGEPLENTRLLAAIAAAKQDKLEEVRILVRQLREEKLEDLEQWQAGEAYCENLKDCDPELIERLFVELESSLSEIQPVPPMDFRETSPPRLLRGVPESRELEGKR